MNWNAKDMSEISLNRIWSEHVRASPTRIRATGLSATSSGCPASSGPDTEVAHQRAIILLLVLAG